MGSGGRSGTWVATLRIVYETPQRGVSTDMEEINLLGSEPGAGWHPQGL
jgi:hypothetical protein